MGRRRSGINIFPTAGDPGKDLFAYLFLLIMVFAFMLMMSSEQAGSAQNAPARKKNGTSALTQVAIENIGVLEKQGSQLLLRFGKNLYDPETDFEKLEQDKRIMTITKDGKNQKILYIEKKGRTSISLFDYLDTFKPLSRKGVSIAFAGRIQ